MFEMLGNVIKNLFSTPATRVFPKEKREPFKDTRGMIGIDITGCIFCGICSRRCPPNAIKVDRNAKTWEVDPFKCIICGECVDVCPKKCMRMNEDYKSPAAGKSTDLYHQEAKPAAEPDEKAKQ